MDKLAIVMPAYNEEENILNVLNTWYRVIENINSENNDDNSMLIVLNDGSKDKTYSIMEQFALTHPYFIPIDKPNSGHGATVLRAYEEALSRGG